jgi:hypothetical protein
LIPVCACAAGRRSGNGSIPRAFRRRQGEFRRFKIRGDHGIRRLEGVCSAVPLFPIVIKMLDGFRRRSGENRGQNSGKARLFSAVMRNRENGPQRTELPGENDPENPT